MYRLNKEEVKWLVILSVLAYYINYLLSTGEICNFIHPRIIIYVHIAFFFLIALCIIQIKRIIFNRDKKKISLNIFLLPILIVFLLKPHGITGNISSFRNAITSNYKSKTDVIYDENKSKSKVDIEVGDKNYTIDVDEITYGKAKKYNGKTIRIKGFIYHDKELAKNQFMITRLMMVCCAADTEFEGIICSYDKAAMLTENKWMTVTGKLTYKKIKFYGETSLMPIIKVDKLQLSKQPKNKYVYPQ